MEKILSVVERALKQSQTDKITSVLRFMPRATACQKPRPVLALAMFNAVRPMAPLPKVNCWETNMIRAVIIEPTKLPVYTTTQLRNRALMLILPLMKTMMIRLLLVKSSEPPTLKWTTPREMAKQFKWRCTPQAREFDPVSTVVNKSVLQPMNAPSKIANSKHPDWVEACQLSSITFSCNNHCMR